MTYLYIAGDFSKAQADELTRLIPERNEQFTFWNRNGVYTAHKYVNDTLGAGMEVVFTGFTFDALAKFVREYFYVPAPTDSEGDRI